MASDDLYSSLSPRKKKRCPPDQESNTFTPKKLRTAPPSPPPTVQAQKSENSSQSKLSGHLARLLETQTALQHALSHALATCAVSPTQDTGIVRSVLNSFSVNAYNGLSMHYSVEDLQRLCWIWEWDAETLDNKAQKEQSEEDDNPFLSHSAPVQPKDWTRGSMGIILSATTHFSKTDKKRVPAYGIGIEVEMDIDKDMSWGMAAVARWTSATQERTQQFRSKLLRWMELNSDVAPVPEIPLANLPRLSSPSSPSKRTLAPSSPRKSSVSPFKSPTKPSKLEMALSNHPSVRAGSVSPTKNAIPFPQTPSSSRSRLAGLGLPTPCTPTTSTTSVAEPSATPSTPAHQRVSSTSSTPQTPSSARRQALYERVRQRSLTASPTKASGSQKAAFSLTRDEILKLGQEELRRRCLLGRLGGVAESIWMFFSAPVSGGPATPSRKRRALPTLDVVQAIIKSSPVPISSSEANESIEMLTNLCPFFLRPLNISGEGWLEMPSLSPGTDELRSTEDSAEEILTRSPKRVKKEGRGLREVREILRRELEMQD